MTSWQNDQVTKWQRIIWTFFYFQNWSQMGLLSTWTNCWEGISQSLVKIYRIPSYLLDLYVFLSIHTCLYTYVHIFCRSLARLWNVFSDYIVSLSLFMCVCVCVCVYVCVYVCCTYVCMCVCVYVCMYVCMYVSMYVCTYVCM